MGPDDSREYQALSHRDAAEIYGEWSDCQGDYDLVGGAVYKVKVVCDQGIEKEFSLSASQSVDYHAREIKK